VNFRIYKVNLNTSKTTNLLNNYKSNFNRNCIRIYKYYLNKLKLCNNWKRNRNKIDLQQNNLEII